MPAIITTIALKRKNFCHKTEFNENNPHTFFDKIGVATLSRVKIGPDEKIGNRKITVKIMLNKKIKRYLEVDCFRLNCGI